VQSRAERKAKLPDADASPISATGTQTSVTPQGIRVAPAPTLLAPLA
jgi:hypothetical protein